jgi:hypothetical protein
MLHLLLPWRCFMKSLRWELIHEGSALPLLRLLRKRPSRSDALLR